MKKAVLSMLAAVFFTGAAFAQTPQIPDFKNTPMILKADGSLDKLEKQTSEMKSKNNGSYFSYAGNNSQSTSEFIEILDSKSPVKVSTKAQFIIKLADAETDPETAIYLTKVTSKKKTREIYTKKGGVMGFGVGKSVKGDYIKLNFEKVQPGVYKITPAELAPGTEYGFVPVSNSSSGGGGTVVYLFGTN
jgi:hypothetical protein